MKKKAFALLLVFAMLLSLLAGCTTGDDGSATNSANPEASAGNGTPDDSPSGTSTSVGRRTEDGRTKVVIGTTNNVGSLDPMLSNAANNRNDVAFLVYERLLYANGDGEFLPQLAKNVETNGNVIVVTIYDGIYDSAGNPVTADDVVFCYQTCKDNASVTELTTLESVTKIDDVTIEFKLSSDDPMEGAADSLLSTVWIVSQKSYEESADSMAANPIGTGPYVLTNFSNGVSLTFEVNEDYWQKDDSERCAYTAQNVDVIEVQIIGDQAQVAIALQGGIIDISDCVAAADAAFFDEGGQYDEGYTMTPVPKNLSLWVNFNMDSGAPTSNINLRRAVAYCFDTPQIIAGGENGFAVENFAPMSNYFNYYPSDWDGRTDYFAYNVDTAKEYLQAYLDESGDSLDNLKLRILANANNSKPSELLGAFLSAIGIQYELMMLDQSVVTTTVTDPGAWDIFVNERGGVANNMNNFWTFWSNQAYSYGHYLFIKDDHLEELVNLACRASTYSEETVKDTLSYIEEQCYSVGLYQRSKVEVYRDWISNIHHTSQLNIAINCCDFNF